MGTQPGREIGLFIPDEFPFLVSGPAEEIEGIETVKVLVTTHPADFQPLFQKGVREGSGADGGRPARSASSSRPRSAAAGTPIATPRRRRGGAARRTGWRST